MLEQPSNPIKETWLMIMVMINTGSLFHVVLFINFLISYLKSISKYFEIMSIRESLKESHFHFL